VIETFKGMPVKTSAIYGGSSMHKQMREIRDGPHIVVATPGRLSDLLRRREIDLSRVEMCVIDEADRLLDMGFEDELKQIYSEMPKSRQSILFSATLPEWTRKMVQRDLKPNQVLVDLASDENASSKFVFSFSSMKINKQSKQCLLL
jgi:superfamily II DNA/RNA helicase